MTLQYLFLPEFLSHSTLFRLVFASLLGAVIGLERDIHGRPAGLRTNLLVSLGSAVFTILSESVAVSFSRTITEAALRADPSRISAQIITGIGFLGAGAIIKSGFSVRGLTTAASLWISAGIGMSVGAGYFDLGVATTLLSLFALSVLNKFEKYYSRDSYRVLQIRTSDQAVVTGLTDAVRRKNVKILFMDTETDYMNKTTTLTLTLKIRHRDITDKVSRDIVSDLEKTGLPLYSVKWSHHS